MYSHLADHRYRYFNTPWASAEPRVGAGNLRIWNTVPPEHLELEFESPPVYVAEQLYGPFFFLGGRRLGTILSRSPTLADNFP